MDGQKAATGAATTTTIVSQNGQLQKQIVLTIFSKNLFSFFESTKSNWVLPRKKPDVEPKPDVNPPGFDRIASRLNNWTVFFA